MNKYLIFLVVFSIGVMIGRLTLPNYNPESNIAATTTGSRTTISPTTTTPILPVTTTTTTTTGTQNQASDTINNIPNSTTTTPTTTVNQQMDVYTPPISQGEPITQPTIPTTKSNTSIYNGVSFLTMNLFRGNVLNDIDQVKSLQKFLITGNILKGVADGKFGPMTQQAVMKFQTMNRIYPAAGYVGPMTREIINAIISDPYNSAGDRAKPKCNCTNISGTPGMQQPSGACQASDNCLWPRSADDITNN